MLTSCQSTYFISVLTIEGSFFHPTNLLPDTTFTRWNCPALLFLYFWALDFFAFLFLWPHHDLCVSFLFFMDEGFKCLWDGTNAKSTCTSTTADSFLSKWVGRSQWSWENFGYNWHALDSSIGYPFSKGSDQWLTSIFYTDWFPMYRLKVLERCFESLVLIK